MVIDYLTKDRWNAYFVGFKIGALSLFSFIFFRHMLGASTFFVKVAAALLNVVNPKHVAHSAYYMQYLKNKAWVDWKVILVIGIFIGSYIASSLSGKIVFRSVPKLWAANFGNSKVKRFVAAFVGGILVLFGARLANGCTSGHIISGGMQLAMAAYFFMLGLFGAGVPAAMLIYRHHIKE